MDEIGLVETVEALGEGVVIAVALRPDRGNRSRLFQPLGVANGEILTRFNRSSQHLDHGGIDEAAAAFEEPSPSLSDEK